MSMRTRVLSLMVAVMVTVGVFADVPNLINYQGSLTDDNGDPITATKSMTFAFYNAETDGDVLPVADAFTETQGVEVIDGVFHVLIGSATTGGVPAAVFDGPTVYLSVKVDAEELTPRQRVASVGFALKAEKADSVESFPAPAYDSGWVEGTMVEISVDLVHDLGVNPDYCLVDATVRFNDPYGYTRIVPCPFQLNADSIVLLHDLFFPNPEVRARIWVYEE